MAAGHSSRQRFSEFLRERRDGDRVVSHDGEAAPAPSRETRAKRRGYFREYMSWLRPFRRAIAGVLVMALGSAALSLVLPRATMYIIDDVVPRNDSVLLHEVGGALLLTIVVQQILDLLRNWSMARLNARVLFRLRQRLFGHLMALPLHQLSQMKTGGITSRLSGDVDSVTGMVQMAVITPGVASIKVAATVAILLWINWKLALAATLLLPVIVVLNLVYIRRIRPIYRSMRKDRAEIDARVVETFGGLRVVRGFSRQKTEQRRYAVNHHTVIRKKLRAEFMEFAIWSSWGLLIPMAALIIIWYGGSLVLKGQATIGGIIAFQMYLMMLLAPVSMIVKSYGDMQQALAALERIFDVLREPIDKPDRRGARNAPDRVEQFEFDRVTFAYDGGETVLRDFTLRVPGGATVALVGPSGAGKTTVTSLVARFYDPTAGAIRLNGVDLRDIKLRSYRGLLGIVQQDTFLFDGTIEENIRYGRPDASRAEVEYAARRANAHEFIAEFPRGYETIVGERGVRLSGGQAQRVSIARALLADPQILILDEATSSLDSESEQLIQVGMRELLTDRTTFVIAHRLSTVVSADLIVVMEHGRIVESGTHAALMASDTRYRTMVERQQRALAETAESLNWLA
jgi:ATP-binding cassette subfamily B protein/subfamily B ATP-binding cassette protein MsbA